MNNPSSSAPVSNWKENWLADRLSRHKRSLREAKTANVPAILPCNVPYKHPIDLMAKGFYQVKQNALVIPVHVPK